ncbi:Cytochrome c family protein [hydrothermal vent metagenome]|uniref:Cytochrome c family protein n=1 Tax=hydrothermal vent metagenome TaxID=652676 RepID=A0A3B0W3Z1_9ZZZZ
MVNFKMKLSLVSLGSVLFLGVAQAGIVGSMHDLSTTNPNVATPVPGGTAEICVFCHTPHGTDTTAPAPLWNKILPTAASFSTYDALGTATLDGQIDLNEGGISLACLSCHDGTTALDLVLNAPTVTQGTYRYDAAGTNLGGGITMASFATSPVPVLGKDLKNDHPVGVQYAGGGLTWAPITGANTVATGANDKLFNEPIWDNNRLWIGAIGDAGLPLYGNSASTFGPTVECASCHNPHKTDYGSFLRMSNAGSGLCLACHIK